MRLVRTVCAVALLALVAAPVAFSLAFTGDSFNIPPAYVGQPYSKQFNGRGGCGPTLPYTFTIIGGALPPGLTLSLSGLDHMYRAPWLAMWPAVALSLAVFGFNMLGDALRDVLDPRLRGTGPGPAGGR